MKAEQRKELETNTLADKMGHVMQRVKASPRRTFLTYFLVAAALIAVAFVGYRWFYGYTAERSLQWLKLYDGDKKHIDELMKEKDTNAGKAARFQFAWLMYWDFGVKMIATDKMGAMQSLKDAVELYGELAEDCKLDPVFEPQALLGRAAAQECLAVQDRNHLKKAEQFYEEILTIHEKKYEKSGEAKFAQQRLDILKNDAQRRELAGTYADLQMLLRIDGPRAPQDLDNPFLHPGFDKNKKP
jgi:hypothetical protein